MILTLHLPAAPPRRRCGAREIIVGRRGASDVAEKGAHDFVTVADKAVQKLLFTELADKYPDFALFGEE